MPREINPDRLIKDAQRVLENPFWIDELNTMMEYSRLHDDDGGTGLGRIGVMFSQDADAFVNFEPPHNRGCLRFRTQFTGGGRSPRVRNALMILALAIKLDNEKHPQYPPPLERLSPPDNDLVIVRA